MHVFKQNMLNVPVWIVRVKGWCVFICCIHIICMNVCIHTQTIIYVYISPEIDIILESMHESFVQHNTSQSDMCWGVRYKPCLLLSKCNYCFLNYQTLLRSSISENVQECTFVFNIWYMNNTMLLLYFSGTFLGKFLTLFS